MRNCFGESSFFLPSRRCCILNSEIYYRLLLLKQLLNYLFSLLKSPSIGYTIHHKKNAGLRIRIDRDLREKFLKFCREQDRPAAQVIREFMRVYVRDHEAVNEGSQGPGNAQNFSSGNRSAE